MYSTYVTKFLLSPYPFNYSYRRTVFFLFLYISSLYSRFQCFIKSKASFFFNLFFVYFYIFLFHTIFFVILCMKDLIFPIYLLAPYIV